MTIDDWRARYDHLNAETDRLRAEVERLREHQERAQYRLAAVEAERDAARAGEARAVEALQNLRIPLAQLGDFMYSPVRDASQELLAIVNSVLANTYTQPALDWLDQQRAEAVAAWIEKEATKCRQQNGEYYDRGVDCMLREAAALRAGEVGND